MASRLWAMFGMSGLIGRAEKYVQARGKSLRLHMIVVMPTRPISPTPTVNVLAVHHVKIHRIPSKVF